jgi:hypothetical protein
MKLCTSTISIDIIQDHSNIPVVHDSYVSEKAKRGLGPLMQSGLCQRCLFALDFLEKLTQPYLPLLPNQSNLSSPVSRVSVIQRTRIFHPLRGSYFCGIGNLVLICIGSRNSCVSGRMRKFLANALFCLLLSKPQFPSTQNCVILVCQSCLPAWARKRTPNVK